jgi:hypothetical protein
MGTETRGAELVKTGAAAARDLPGAGRVHGLAVKLVRIGRVLGSGRAGTIQGTGVL